MENLEIRFPTNESTKRNTNVAASRANIKIIGVGGAGTNAILTKRAEKGMDEFENDMEAYAKELQKRRVKVALMSTAITAASAAGLAFGSAFRMTAAASLFRVASAPPFSGSMMMAGI